jgi:hypothetical protein
MDSETRKLDPQDAARVQGNPPAPTTPMPGAAPMPPVPPVSPIPPVPAVPPEGPRPSVAATNGVPPTAPGTYPSPAQAPRPVAPPMFGGNNIIPIALIVLGALLLFTPFSLGDLFGSAIVLVIGLAFLYAYAQGRNVGLLIPGAILTGLGAGIVMESMGTGDGWVPLGLGLGFCAIWFLHRAFWWALIPGGIIALAGLQDLVTSDSTLSTLFNGFHLSGGWWPLLLILGGIWLIASRNNMIRR